MCFCIGPRSITVSCFVCDFPPCDVSPLLLWHLINSVSEGNVALCSFQSCSLFCYNIVCHLQFWAKKKPVDHHWHRKRKTGRCTDLLGDVKARWPLLGLKITANLIFSYLNYRLYSAEASLQSGREKAGRPHLSNRSGREFLMVCVSVVVDYDVWGFGAEDHV